MEDNISEVNESPINKLIAIYGALKDVFNDTLIVKTPTGNKYCLMLQIVYLMN